MMAGLTIGFLNPLLLWGLLILPILWVFLRVVPPAPIRRRFPGVALLLGLQDQSAQADRTPWWLMALRMLALAAVIVAFAGPILHPQDRAGGKGPLLVLLDGSWADAADWPRRIDRVAGLVADAGRSGRPVAVAVLTAAPDAIEFQTADQWAPRVAGLAPAAWAPSRIADWIAALPQGEFETEWLTAGLDYQGRDDLFAELAERGTVTVFQSPRPVLALAPPTFADGEMALQATRLPAGGEQAIEIAARGPDPAGIDRELGRATLTFAAGKAEAKGTMPLLAEVRNRINRFEIVSYRSAAAVSLADDSLKRRKVALITTRAGREGLTLLSPAHYLRQALRPNVDLIEGGLADMLTATPDVIVLPDVARLTEAEAAGLTEWLDQGGMLLRFAGPQMAAAADPAAQVDDPLMPVRLRQGGRAVGGAMSWGEPQALAPFPDTSPFFGLAIPPDVTVSEQVLAQPDPDLGPRTIAALADGTPLVTRRAVGQGQVVLFHVTANAEWSTLPLSGLFMQMLERLAVSTRPDQPDANDLAGQIWVPEIRLDAFGAEAAAGDVAGAEGAALAKALTDGPDANLPPGRYAGGDRRVALNVIGAETELVAATWPAGTVIVGMDAARETRLMGALLVAAIMLLLADILAALAVSGRLARQGRGAAVLIAALLLAVPDDARAADDAMALQATGGVVLAHVVTGDKAVDDLAHAGLIGLGERLTQRTAIEPDPPMAVNVETDELAFYPFLYWPVTANQPLPSAAAYAKLNDYLRTGGLILFDTRDAGIPTSAATPEGAALQRIAAGLSIPPLQPIPQDHVLTRAFYLLQDFPGRYQGNPVWVEQIPEQAEQADGMPFRHLNDGVTPVVIGGNDWASAWAVDGFGTPLLPVGRGETGERQREMAIRFGINLIMHVLTGNYKSDQVHVPALLERLGQE